MGERRRYASSTDVARLAGVSQSAVSRTYTKGRSVSAATRAKVLAAAGELGYRPSLIPRIMLTHRSHLVAIVVGGLYNPFYSAVLEQFAICLPEIGFQPLLVHVDSGDLLDDALPRLASYRVDAVVSALAIRSARSAATLAELAIPVIAFNTTFRNAWVSSVSADNEQAGRTIANLFLDRGGRRFGFIAGARSSAASEARLKGYRSGLRARGIQEVEVERADFRYEDGASAVAALFRGRTGPDAIFCANDLIAMGAGGRPASPPGSRGPAGRARRGVRRHSRRVMGRLLAYDLHARQRWDGRPGGGAAASGHGQLGALRWTASGTAESAG